MEIDLFRVRNDKKSRFEDIQIMLSVLHECKKVDHQLLIKSSLMLMIYNSIEGTISNLLTELFDAIQQKHLSMEHLPDKLQETINTYHLKRIGSSPKKLKEYYECDTAKLCGLSYLEINKYLKLFSGNLDSCSIRNISSDLGVKLKKGIDEPVLLKVKNCRNKLAHGETKFRNTCQDITENEIELMVQKVEVYLTEIIDEYENFLNRI